MCVYNSVIQIVDEQSSENAMLCFIWFYVGVSTGSGVLVVVFEHMLWHDAALRLICDVYCCKQDRLFFLTDV